MTGRNERVMALGLPLVIASILAVLVGGCGGDLSLHLMQRDLDSMRSEVAAVSRTNEGEKAFIEERLAKLEADLRGRLDKALKERNEDVEEFLRSQASLTTKLDDLTGEARLTQGRIEELGHRISELNKRFDAHGDQLGQVGRRLDGVEKQVNQVVATTQETKVTGQSATAAAQNATALAQQATTASQQMAHEVTNALRQMADQTNTALQQVNATTQLALIEARKAGVAKQTAQPADQQAPPPAVKLPPPISISPPAPVAPPPSPLAPPRPPAKVAATPAELYKNALNDYTKGKYDLAIDGFRTYIFLYPDTSLLPNAQYWLGESLYGLKNYGVAIPQFELFLTDYPEHAKVAGALLKQGYAYLEMGNPAEGRTVLTNLIKRYPKSPEARSAKQRLSKVKKSPASGSRAKAPSKRAP